MIHFSLIYHHNMDIKCPKGSFIMGTFSDPQLTRPGISYWSDPPPPRGTIPYIYQTTIQSPSVFYNTSKCGFDKSDITNTKWRLIKFATRHRPYVILAKVKCRNIGRIINNGKVVSITDLKFERRVRKGIVSDVSF